MVFKLMVEENLVVCWIILEQKVYFGQRKQDNKVGKSNEKIFPVL